MNIYTIPMGMVSCYIVQDEGTIMIDGGFPDKLDSFNESLKKASIDPKQIKLIVHTHGHSDHIGSTRALKEATGAQIAIHEPDKEWLEKSLNQMPPGVTTWGRILMKMLSAYSRSIQISATEVDIVLSDEEFSLVPFGIPGRVVYTPGHTMGSVSVLLDTGEVFVGDLAMNGLPFKLGPGLPIFAENMELLKKSWRLLLDQGVKTVYPGHGKPFPADIIRKALQ